MNWNMYKLLREKYSVQRRKLENLPKDVKGESFIQETVLRVIDNVIRENDVSKESTCGIFKIEEALINNGNKMIFSGNSDLLHMLWNAKMDLDISDIKFPESFRISWPDDFSINGLKPFPCCVCFQDATKHANLEKSFIRKYIPPELVLPGTKEKIEYFEKMEKHHKILSVAYFYNDNSLNYVVKPIVSNYDLNDFLSSETQMTSRLKILEGRTLCNDNDRHYRFHLTLKLIFRLMVYATACPEAVIDGFPKGVDDFAVSGGWTKKHTPVYFRMPSVGRDGTIPTLHKRRWHFRQYPIKKDNTRTPGVVLVKECWVNANVDPKVDPKTVINVL